MKKSSVSGTTKSRDADRTIQVLYEISNAVNNTFNLNELYRAIHKSLGKVINVDNFFIAIHNKEKDSLSFPYRVDELGHNEKEVFEISKKNSLTARVINNRKPMLAQEKELLKIIGETPGETIGSPCKVWVGVPLRVKKKVLGAIVLQSYTSENVYKQSDLELLNSVSEFIALAIERKKSEEDIIQNERLTQTLFAISTAVNTTDNLDDLYASIYRSLDSLMSLPNFFIAVVNPNNKNSLHFPFYFDEFDSEETISFTVDDIYESTYITTDVLKTKKPLFLTHEMAIKRKEEGKITGKLPMIWLGVPLMIRKEVIGVMAIQHYEDPDYFSEKDLDLLISVSDQVALAIDRKRAQETIHEREIEITRLSNQTEKFSMVAASIISVKDEKQIFKDICKAIVEHSDYNRLLMSHFIDEPPYRIIIGFEGISEKEIDKVRSKDAPKSFYERIYETGIGLGNLSCYLPHDYNNALGDERLISSNKEQDNSSKSWHPEDMLFIKMNDAKGNFIGVISVDDSKSCIKPTNETVRPLEIFSSLISQIIIFRKIQNELKDHKENLELMVGDRTKELTTEISERIQIEKRLKKAKIAAEAASHAKGEFLANMSHEIRTPINGIMGMAELALDHAVEKEQKKIIQTIDSEANALLSIINDVLDFSKIEVGKLEIENISFDLRHTFEHTSASLSLGINEKGIEFISYLSPKIPTHLIGDPGRLRQILLNLASNAVKFTHEGEIFIQGKLINEDNEHVELEFSVQDTGIGIPDEKQKTIFDSFSQADGSTTREYGGTGLGTTISKQLVELMGGKIGLESQEKVGSRFWFTLPFEKSAEFKMGTTKPFLTDYTILVVEGNETSTYVLDNYLTSFGTTVRIAENGQKALSMLQNDVDNNTLPNVIIANYQLPDQDGFEFAKEVKRIKTCEKIPFIILTASGRSGDGKVCKEIGIDGYLLKPVKRQELKLAIDTVIGHRSQAMENNINLVTRHTIAEQMAKNISILLVEDYPTNQQIAMKHLSGAGYQATLAQNGQIAVKCFKEKHFDLILMDIQMPEMDGYEATRQIREHEKKIRQIGSSSIRTPIIALTAHAMKGYKEKCLSADMDDYMTKPLKRKLFLSLIRKWTSKINANRSVKESFLSETNDKEEHIISDATDDYPMNYDKALEEFEDDKEFLNEVLEEFLENIEHQLPLIEAAIENNDYEIVRKESHAIKGGSANLTAMSLSKIAHDLELMGKQEKLDEGRQTYNRLNEEYSKLNMFFKQL